MNPAIRVIDLNNDLNFIQESELNVENKSNVAIASAVTSYARVHMLKLKKYCIENNIKIFYFDTDSLFIDKPLPTSFITNNLGDLKLEYIFKEAVFLGPKIYAGITTEDKYICKVKGYKNSKEIPFDKMKSLLNEGAVLELNHVKWFRSLSRSDISLLKSPYLLTPTQNKRKLIYEKGRAVNSHPFKIPLIT